MERLQHTYRLVIMNNETFEEIGSYRLSLLNVYIALSTLMVLVAILVVSLIVFTPLKRLVPGYGDVSSHPELIHLNREIDSLSEALEAQQVYTESFRKILVGDVETIQEVPEEEYQPGDSTLQVDRIKEDEILRREVELEEIQEIAQLTKANNFSSRDLPLEQMYFTPPLSGEVSAGFAPDKKHYGVDVLAPKNTAIKAVMDGWVIASDWTLETGNTIGIQHANNIVTFYKHNSVLLKEIGSFVKAGEAVAIIGNTGTLSDGPHLHFELWSKGVPVDPAQYINFN
ncbi:MAG: M23 family metallopeptidase [Saprospiraceae bacterium]|nr:M23 family metallopeptidase [Saprospiraceae bacterium]MCB0624756.1 M23 family metallopeptidase [Saprospiraceae bacterium]MCB0678537.1 M23 family metallopeptidase [Saprospiraceae bacterium]MCB0681690.1 M23 family metallopeptidase [Saprospiraceae bacterium]